MRRCANVVAVRWGTISGVTIRSLSPEDESLPPARLFWSEMSPSMSMLQLVTASGCVIATLFRVRTAAKRSTGFELDRNSWSTVIA